MKEDAGGVLTVGSAPVDSMVKIVELDDDVTAVGIGLAGSEVSEISIV